MEVVCLSAVIIIQKTIYCVVFEWILFDSSRCCCWLVCAAAVVVVTEFSAETQYSSIDPSLSFSIPKVYF